MPDPDNTQTASQTTQTQTAQDAQGTQGTQDTQTQVQTQTAVLEPPKGIVNPDGTFVEGWESRFPEEDRATLKRFKKVDDLPKSYMDLRKKFGRPVDKLVEIPDETSPDDIKLAFKKATGWSEKSDDYKYEKLPDTVKDKINPIEPERLSAFRDFAHKELEISPAKFTKLLDYYHTMLASDVDGYNEKFQAFVEENRKKGVDVLGKQFGTGLEQRTRRAEAVMEKYGNFIVKFNGSEINVLEQLEKENPNITTSPWLRIIFDRVAESVGEDTLKGITGRVTTPTVPDIEKKISELRASKAYSDAMNPDHNRVLNEIRKLYEQKKAK